MKLRKQGIHTDTSSTTVGANRSRGRDAKPRAFACKPCAGRIETIRSRIQRIRKVAGLPTPKEESMTERAAVSRGLGGKGKNRIAAVLIMAALALVAFTGLLSGQTLTVTSVIGTWENTDLEGTAGAASGEGTSYIYWGSGDDGASGYRFNAEPGPISLPQDTEVLDGEFVH